MVGDRSYGVNDVDTRWGSTTKDRTQYWSPMPKLDIGCKCWYMYYIPLLSVYITIFIHGWGAFGHVIIRVVALSQGCKGSTL